MDKETFTLLFQIACSVVITFGAVILTDIRDRLKTNTDKIDNIAEKMVTKDVCRREVDDKWNAINASRDSINGLKVKVARIEAARNIDDDSSGDRHHHS